MRKQESDLGHQEHARPAANARSDVMPQKSGFPAVDAGSTNLPIVY